MAEKEVAEFLTHLLVERRGSPTTQEQLGHSDVSTTKIYTHVLKRGARGVRSPLSDLGSDIAPNPDDDTDSEC